MRGPGSAHVEDIWIGISVSQWEQVMVLRWDLVMQFLQQELRQYVRENRTQEKMRGMGDRFEQKGLARKCVAEEGLENHKV